MSVNHTFYVILGAKIDPKLYEQQEGDDDVVSMREGRPGEKFLIVEDGMSGEYCVMGKCLVAIDDFEDDGAFMELKLPEFSDWIEVQMKFMQVFGISPEIKLLAFKHYY